MNESQGVSAIVEGCAVTSSPHYGWSLTIECCIVVQWGLLVGWLLSTQLTVSDDMSERCCVPWVPTGLPWVSADEPTEGICALDPKGIGGGIFVMGEWSVLLN